MARAGDRRSRAVGASAQGGPRLPPRLFDVRLRRPDCRRAGGAHGARAARTDDDHVQPRDVSGAAAYSRAPGHGGVRDSRVARGRQPGAHGDRRRVPPGAQLHVAGVAGRAVRVLGRGAARLRPLREPADAQRGGGLAVGHELGRASRAPAGRGAAHHGHSGRSGARAAGVHPDRGGGGDGAARHRLRALRAADRGRRDALSGHPRLGRLGAGLDRLGRDPRPVTRPGAGVGQDQPGGAARLQPRPGVRVRRRLGAVAATAGAPASAGSSAATR